jgi:hypothetical protein
MAAFGRSLFDLDQLTEETDLDRLLAHTRDLARLSKLLVLGLRFEEHGEAPRDYNDDWDLLHSALWPLERVCERAIELEGDAGVAPANAREENRRCVSV